MRISVMLIPLLLAFALPANAQSQSPIMRSVEPDSGKAGDVLAVQGENLGQDHVAALYLTDGNTDFKVPIVEQSATVLKFRIPPEAKPGRLALMVLTKEKDPKLIEQPVKITVEPVTATNSDGHQ